MSEQPTPVQKSVDIDRVPVAFRVQGYGEVVSLDLEALGHTAATLPGVVAFIELDAAAASRLGRRLSAASEEGEQGADGADDPGHDADGVGRDGEGGAHGQGHTPVLAIYVPPLRLRAALRLTLVALQRSFSVLLRPPFRGFALGACGGFQACAGVVDGHVDCVRRSVGEQVMDADVAHPRRDDQVVPDLGDAQVAVMGDPLGHGQVTLVLPVGRPLVASHDGPLPAVQGGVLVQSGDGGLRVHAAESTAGGAA